MNNYIWQWWYAGVLLAAFIAYGIAGDFEDKIIESNDPSYTHCMAVTELALQDSRIPIAGSRQFPASNGTITRVTHTDGPSHHRVFICTEGDSRMVELRDGRQAYGVQL